MATSANITYRKLYTIGKSKLCWFQTCANGIGRQSGREDMSKTKMALNPRLRLEVFHVTVKRPSKVGQRKVCSLVRNRNYYRMPNLLLKNIRSDTAGYCSVSTAFYSATKSSIFNIVLQSAIELIT